MELILIQTITTSLPEPIATSNKRDKKALEVRLRLWWSALPPPAVFSLLQRKNWSVRVSVMFASMHLTWTRMEHCLALSSVLKAWNSRHSTLRASVSSFRIIENSLLWEIENNKTINMWQLVLLFNIAKWSIVLWVGTLGDWKAKYKPYHDGLLKTGLHLELFIF